LNKLFLAALVALPFLASFGCRSAKPPPPVPQAVAVAGRFSSQAETLSEQQNWPAAVAEWKKAAEQFALLNDLPQQAVALHNEGEAEQEQRHLEEARHLFESAAVLNQKTGREEEWWRNQIALLQVDAGLGNRSQDLEKRFEELLPKSKNLHQPLLEGLFQNELGLWHLYKMQWKEAGAAFGSAEKNFQQVQSQAGVAATLANRALLAESTQEFAAAEPLWRDALSRYEKLAAPAGIARSLAGVGRSLLKQEKKLPESEDFLRRAADNFGVLKLESERKKTLQALAANLKAQGRDADAEKVSKGLEGR
jgi:tetratricopeptide (TPR) repeat protein